MTLKIIKNLTLLLWRGGVCVPSSCIWENPSTALTNGIQRKWFCVSFWGPVLKVEASTYFLLKHSRLEPSHHTVRKLKQLHESHVEKKQVSWLTASCWVPSQQPSLTCQPCEQAILSVDIQLQSNHPRSHCRNRDKTPHQPLAKF